MTPAYYNEIDPYASAWLRELADAGHVAPGYIDTRSIADVTPDETGDGAAHFFAGIGGWSLALRLAGVPDDARIWTGSCPCQPFSTAGRGRGADDERHLWPVWYRLIAECRPPVVFGEQVASRAGRDWLAAVRADLEGLGYAVGGADLCAAGIGAPHIRQRLWWVAYDDSAGRIGLASSGLRLRESGGGADGCGDDGRARMDDTARRGCHEGPGVDDAAERTEASVSDVGGEGRRLGHPDCDGARRDSGTGPCTETESSRCGVVAGRVGDVSGAPGAWSRVGWVDCSDGKRRPVEPGTFPLAHGVSGRVGRLRAYGNAIVPQLAAAFVRAALDAIGDVA